MTWDSAFQLVSLVISIVAVTLNNYRNKWNFPLFIAVYVLWAIIYWQHGVYAATLKEVIFIGFNIHGWKLWIEHDRRKLGVITERSKTVKGKVLQERGESGGRIQKSGLGSWWVRRQSI